MSLSSPKSAFLKTSELAQAAGIHPNTVRLYVSWGFVPAPPRGRNGYRHWTRAHLTQLLFARDALHEPWPGLSVRDAAAAMVGIACKKGPRAALPSARELLRMVRSEQAHAHAVHLALEASSASDQPMYTARAAADLTATSLGQIRGWERSGLLVPLRAPLTKQRRYGAAELKRLRLVRTLILAGHGASQIRELLSVASAFPSPQLLSALDTWEASLQLQEERARRLIAWLSTLARQH